jgi:hypothetical protein
MNIWNEGRYSTNIKWVAQLLFNGGVEELEKWLDTLDEQEDKDDIVLMLVQMVQYLNKTIEPTVEGAEYIEPQPVESPTIRQKPFLRIVRDDETE